MARSPDGLQDPEPRGPVEAPLARHARLDLSERLERLPHGHPSSPYHADGSPKPPVALPHASDIPENSDPGAPRDTPGERPALADSRPHPERSPDSHSEPFTDARWAEHVHEVSDRLERARADGQATDERYTLDSRREVWAEARESCHDVLIEELYQRAANVPNERRAIIAGGLPGAGKTTVLEHHTGIDRTRFLMINPDDVKAEMARRGLVPHVEGLSPMEASDLAHEESSHVAKRLARRAQADGKNIIWDITMSSPASTQARIDDLRKNGYTHVEGVFVDLPPAVSAARADGRHRIDEEKYRAGTAEGGRFIPADVIMANTDPAWGSVNRKTFEAVKPALDRWSVYDNSLDGRAAVLVDSSQPKERNL